MVGLGRSLAPVGRGRKNRALFFVADQGTADGCSVHPSSRCLLFFSMNGVQGPRPGAAAAARMLSGGGPSRDPLPVSNDFASLARAIHCQSDSIDNLASKFDALGARLDAGDVRATRVEGRLHTLEEENKELQQKLQQKLQQMEQVCPRLTVLCCLCATAPIGVEV